MEYAAQGAPQQLQAVVSRLQAARMAGSLRRRQHRSATLDMLFRDQTTAPVATGEETPPSSLQTITLKLASMQHQINANNDAALEAIGIMQLSLQNILVSQQQMVATQQQITDTNAATVKALASLQAAQRAHETATNFKMAGAMLGAAAVAAMVAMSRRRHTNDVANAA